MPPKWRRVGIEVPEWLGPDDRAQLADDIIEFIRRRTDSGLDKDNRKFPPYSKSYMQSLDFKVAGKGKNVDLQLSGDMMASLSLLSHTKGRLLIGFENGTPENDRADGNITGSYGGSPNRRKARDFLGIADEDLARILIHYGGPKGEGE
jgi:hypothetical protein